MFTSEQLRLMVRVQSSEDWHASYFVEALKTYYANPTDDWLGVVVIAQHEFDNLLDMLSKASERDICYLQHALTSLSLISESIFEVKHDVQ